jgi:polysaccharide export outer membrane protein
MPGHCEATRGTNVINSSETDAKVGASESRRRPRSCVAATLALATWLGTSVGVSAPIGSGEYRLAPGDRLSIVVFGQAELSGDFMVDGGGRIELPIAGAVTIGELTIAEAQSLIQARFSDGVLVKPAVMVRIVEQRPVYVVGDVRAPGSYPFRFGQSATIAIAMAGGHGRTLDQQNAMSDFIAADERVRVLETTRRGLLMRKARLEAQRDGAQEFVPPKLPGIETHEREFAALAAGEAEIFATLTQAYHQLVAALRQQPPRLEAEITALKQQVIKERESLSLSKDRVDEVEPLAKTGLLQRSVLNDRRREVLRIESQILQLTALIARLDQGIGDVNIRIDDATVAYRRQIMTDLQDMSQRLREIEATLITARELRELRAQNAGGIEGVEAAYTILITRTRTSTTTFQASGETLLEPGDVVEVKRQRRGVSRAAGLVEDRERLGSERAGRMPQ